MPKNKKDGSAQHDATFPKKFASKLPTGWQEGADSMTTEELEKVIVKSRGSIADTEKDMELDGKLATLKEDMKAVAGGYRDQQGMEDAKIRYALHILRSRGVR